MSKSNRSEFYWHESAGARILIPPQFSVVQPFPELYAKARKDFSSFIVTITSSRLHLNMVERLLRSPPKSIPPWEVQIIRDISISYPFKGQELVVEMRMTEHLSVTSTLRRVMHLDEATGVFADINVGSKGTVDEWEPIWQTVLDSFSWDSLMGIFLRMDGDEIAFRVRHKKKSKRSRKASLPKLPTALQYLQKVIDELMSLPPEEVNEDWDSSPLVKALEKRVKSLPLADAETRLDEDVQLVHEWINEDADSRVAGEFMAAFMAGFRFHLGAS
jgi:hypothetical protein